jgi:hypothetical protein
MGIKGDQHLTIPAHLHAEKKRDFCIMSTKNFRPGQFGIFAIVQHEGDLNHIITSALQFVACLRLKNVEWLNLGSNIFAILFTSFRSQIYLSEWQMIFKYMFQNTLTPDRQRENSKHVVKMISDTRQLNPMHMNHFQVHFILFSGSERCSGILKLRILADLHQRGSVLRAQTLPETTEEAGRRTSERADQAQAAPRLQWWSFLW